MTDDTGITIGGQITAGILLILFTAGAIIMLFGLWPDRLPDADNKCQLYADRLFAIRLLPEDTCCTTPKSGSLASADSTKPAVNKPCCCIQEHTITLNKLLFILVCLGGFLGAMLHSASSFSAYIGAGKFVRSWKLWYFVNPFIGAGLAMTIYFALHAGFLSKENDAGDVNIYGAMTMALLTGLFTRVATQKLKEIFEAAFKPKGDLPNKIDEPKPEFLSVEPEKLDPAKDNTINIKGKNLDKSHLTININDEPVNDIKITKDTISFTYKVPATQAGATSFKLDILDENDKIIKTFNLSA